MLVTIVGTVPFVAVRLGSSSPRQTIFGLLALVGAAVAEELLFRRALYARLERFGPLVAVAASAVVFALVHIPVYGWRVLLIDLGAGAVFGWQRWASGTWTAPALTHVIANL